MEKARLLFIDNLRILLITLVIMLHLSVTYGGEGSWYYKEGQPDDISFVLLTWHNGTVQAFSMGFLFMISGYFTAASYDRKGPWRFLKDRLLRLGIPLLCYDFVIGPLLAYPLIRVGARESPGSYFDYLARYYSRFHIGTGPLWFVESLLIFAAFYVLWRLLIKRMAGPGKSDTKFPSCMTIAVFALVLGIVSFTVRIWLPIGWSFEPLNLQFPFFPQYICLFTIGVVAYRRNWLMRIDDAVGKFWLSIGIIFIVVLFPAMFVAGGAFEGDVSSFAGDFHWQCLAYSVWEQFIGVAMVIGLSVLFRKRLNRQGKLVKKMSASSYTAYIVHAPVLVLLALAIRNITLYPLLKFALAGLIAVPLCFALGNFIRQLPLARRIL
ncbi:MAG: acyltransferase family protein [Planctomycetota bacterium]|jgi:fucose 4-O-acetylase-like acetyltransferase